MIKMVSEEEFKKLNEEEKYLLYKGVYMQVNNSLQDVKKELTKDLDKKSTDYAFAMGCAVGTLSRCFGDIFLREYSE